MGKRPAHPETGEWLKCSCRSVHEDWTLSGGGPAGRLHVLEEARVKGERGRGFKMSGKGLEQLGNRKMGKKQGKVQISRTGAWPEISGSHLQGSVLFFSRLQLPALKSGGSRMGINPSSGVCKSDVPKDEQS